MQSDPLTARRYGILLTLVVLGALGLRVAMTTVFVGLDSPPDGDANSDQIEYELFAHHLASGKGYTLENGDATAIRPPGTSLTLWPVYQVFGRSWPLGRLWFCLLSALTCAVVAWAAGVYFGPRTALLTAGMLALFPGHFYYSMHFVSEVPFALTVALIVGCLLNAWKHRTWKYEVWAGLAIGFAVLIRPQAILLIPLGGAVWLLSQLRGTRHSWRLPLVVSLVAATVVIPWVMRNQTEMGKATLSTIGGYTFWGAHNPVVAASAKLRGSWMPVDDLIDADHPVDGNEVEREAATWRHGIAYVKAHPGTAIQLLGWKVWRLVSPFKRTPNQAVYWTFALAWLLLAPLTALGIWRLFRESAAAAWIIVLPLCVTLATALVFYGSVRFRDSVSSILILPAAYAAARWIFPADRNQALSGLEMARPVADTPAGQSPDGGPGQDVYRESVAPESHS